MNEPTVTMSLSEFKRMEAKVIAYDRIRSEKKGPMLVYWAGAYAGDWIVVDDDANTLLVKELEDAHKRYDDLEKKLYKRNLLQRWLS